MRSFLRALTFTAFALASCAALAEKSAKPATQTPQAKQELKMDTAQLVGLIKSTIMALQHANQTGNYSVLRDLGSPVFRERFDQAQLTAVFSNLRSRGVNLTPVLFLLPNLTKQPEMTEGNQLHIVGDFLSGGCIESARMLNEVAHILDDEVAALDKRLTVVVCLDREKQH
jgi:hypothetical protein